jgi:GNAT superfamily N-acetyltransferase
MTGVTAVERLVDLEGAGADGAALVAGIDAVFAETTRRTFADAQSRAAFRELWLGQYLLRDRDLVFVARDMTGAVAGYLVGALEDPARSDRYPGLGYFRDFAAVTPAYPAHLHINLTAAARGQGTGARLIEAFVAAARQRGSPGVHVVTGAAERNVGFYLRNGFHERARADWNGRPLLLLAREIGAMPIAGLPDARGPSTSRDTRGRS